MQFRDLRALNVKLPKIDTAGSNLIKNELIVSISKDGEFFANNKPVSLGKLTQLFEVTSTLPQKPVILVVADEEVPLKYVTQVVDLCRKNGLDDFRLLAR